MKRLFSFIVAVTLCLGTAISSSAAGENQYIEPPVNMPDIPTTMTVPNNDQEYDVDGIGIDLFREMPEDFVMPRATLATMNKDYDKRIVQLAIKFSGASGTFYGTGFVIDPNAIATAAHNFNHPTYGRATSITCYVGVSTGISYLYSETITDTSRFLHPSEWDSTKGYRYDYGVIKLKNNMTNVGSFGFGAYSDSVLSSNTFKLMGYGTNGYPSSATSTLNNIGTNDFYYAINTRPGDSGSPVYYGNGSVAGIHAYGTSSSAQYPSATRITSKVFNDLKTWKYQ